ncbi:tryptophanyl-tRNA synthetase [Candidatus Endomicrobiellum trichonymphae]|uniref:Tryptophan--tRNA ligase n=2 Tax=Endomicrobium trichonymphae TaxID=1408204 RepID=B1GZV0_ENDTX|nr:tryptophanyl-tRNA synthetase [Candidatus Endomicrobium trichonymphae]
MSKVLSGMRPTGRLHLGHYFGVLMNWVKFQNECECYYMSADWHVLTTSYVDTSAVNENTLEMVADWITAGVDPEKSVFFKQSGVLYHSELFLILSMITPLSWLQRCPTYKEQISQIKNKDLSNYGFLGYPILMSADILLYKANIVPIGEDQLSHLELTRKIARRFNNFYGDTFIEPKEELTKAASVPGLDGRKMSKSYGNSILLGESDDILRDKVKSMFTDPLKIKTADPGHPCGCVVFAFHEIFGIEYKNREEECKAGAIGCMSCKKQLMEMLSEFMKPLTEKRKDLIADKAYLEKIVEAGCRKAAEIAQQTMEEIRKAMKF